MAHCRTTSLTPLDSASNIHVNYIYGNDTAPGTVTGSVVGPSHPESTVSRKCKKDKTGSTLSTVMSASRSTTKPPTEQPQPPEPAPSIPQISIPASPAVSSSIDGSSSTNPGTPVTTRSLKSSLASSLSYATNHSEQPPPPQLPAMSRQNSDAESVIAGGLGSALGGVLTNLWGPYKSASASPIMENPPPGPVTAGFDLTLTGGEGSINQGIHAVYIVFF